MLRGDGGRRRDGQGGRAETAATKHCGEAQDCRAGDAARRIDRSYRAGAWRQRQHGALLAQALSRGPPGTEQDHQRASASGLGERSGAEFGGTIPTTMSAAAAVVPASTAGAIYIEFAKIHLRIENGADAALLRVVLETLQR